MALEQSLLNLFQKFKPPNEYDQIEEKLFISNIEFAQNEENIKKYKISNIVCILNNIELKELYTTRHKNVTYFIISAKDKSCEYLYLHFEKAANFIENCINNNTNVLVHCLAGVSRSPTIVAAYLIIKRKMTVEEAISYIQLNKSIRPNNGFLRQLQQLYTSKLNQ